MRRHAPLPRLLLATVLAAGLALPALAQDKALPDAEPKDPRGVLSTQRLEVANKEMAYAAERLEKAAEEGDESATRGAFDESRQTVEEVRKLIRPLPEGERAPFEAAIGEAESALAGGDPQTGARAMRDLREKVIELLAAGG